MPTRRRTALAVLLSGGMAITAPAEPPAQGPTALVLCAPGYPGSTGEAASVMSGFADALAAAAGQPRGSLSAEYHQSEAGALERISRPDAGFLFSPLPFFLQHEAALQLAAHAQPVMQGGEASEVFSLVAGKGRVNAPAALAGWELFGTVGYAPRFVRGPVLGEWGVLPATTRITFSGAVLSGLRRAAAGEKVAVILDGAQAAGLASLPYGAELAVVTRSRPLPAFVVATVGSRVAPARANGIVKALLGLAARPDGAAVLANLRLTRFVPLDQAGLKRARNAWAAAPTTP